MYVYPGGGGGGEGGGGGRLGDGQVYMPSTIALESGVEFRFEKDTKRSWEARRRRIVTWEEVESGVGKSLFE